MDFSRNHKKTSFFIVFIFLIITDQLIKYIVRSWGGFYICNTGIAFGLHLPFWLVLAIAIAFLFIISLLIFDFKFSISKTALCFILAGAVSNIIDRLRFGCVIDFIDLKFWSANIAMRSITGWPIFNLADSFIVIGVIIALYKFKK